LRGVGCGVWGVDYGVRVAGSASPLAVAAVRLIDQETEISNEIRFSTFKQGGVSGPPNSDQRAPRNMVGTTCDELIRIKVDLV